MQWTKERNKLTEMSLQPNLQMNLDFELRCHAIHNAFSNNKALLAPIIFIKIYDII